MPIDWDQDSLERLLGKHGQTLFARRYLLHQGCTEEEVDRITGDSCSPLLSRISDVRKRREATIQRLRQERQSLRQEGEYPHRLALALTDEVHIDLVLVPAGEFLMGSPDSEDHPNESPQRVVRFERPFYMGRFPVTQSQWFAVMGEQPVSTHRKPRIAGRAGKLARLSGIL